MYGHIGYEIAIPTSCGQERGVANYTPILLPDDAAGQTSRCRRKPKEQVIYRIAGTGQHVLAAVESFAEYQLQQVNNLGAVTDNIDGTESI
jgi:hypothetical protein